MHGTDGGSIDRLAASVVTDVQAYWSATFPELFGKPWHDLDGGFYSADTSAADSRPPPCSGTVQSLEGNAYYCGSVDAIAWDRGALLPVLREHYGDAAVAVVLGHELGHAVQQRAGMDVGSSRDPMRTEAGADCYAGAFMRSAADGHAPHLRFTDQQRDQALHALIVFRDPVGAGSGDAHGSSFDRITAFQDGYQRGPGQCGQVPADSDQLTNGRADDGNQRFDDVLARRPGAEFFDELVAEPGPAAPPIRPAEGSGCAAAPVSYCAGGPAVVFDRAGLSALHDDIGDQATATLLASRQAIAALGALGRPTTGPDAGRAASCLTGAYTARTPDLSAGDLDEAVETLLVSDAVSRDAQGGQALTGADRVDAFRTGLTGGPSACR